MSLSPQFLDELRARTSLSGLIGRTTKLQRAGREWKACCPFHNEKTPSFYVNDEKGFYHCFGCQAHGDAIRWLTDARGLPFMDAVKELAVAVGMDVPAPDPRAQERSERAAGLYEVMEAAAGWFKEQLDGIEGETARSYLKRRGIREETRLRFGCGFAPDARRKLKAALGKFSDEKLIEAGLLIHPEGDKEPYDRFRGRLMFPIRDARGRCIAFSGRILGEGEPKYLNSPDTPLFDKGRTLFNLDKAAPASRASHRIIVVEGQMDVVALDQAGFPEAVAPLGTAVTEAQIQKLWQLSEQPILCFDGDSAGKKAAARTARRSLAILAPGKTLAVAQLPANQDPDDIVKSGGKAAFEEVLSEATNLSEFLWKTEVEAEDLDTPEARAELGRRLRKLAQSIPEEDVRTQYLGFFNGRLSELFERFKRGGSGARYHASLKDRGLPPEMLAIFKVGIDQAVIARVVLEGLRRYPALIAEFAEAIALIWIRTRKWALIRDGMLMAAMERWPLDCEALQELLRRDGLTLDALKKPRDLAFSFLREGVDEGAAQRDLAEVIEKITSGRSLDEAIRAAERRLADADGADWDAAFRELERLYERRRADAQDLRDFWATRDEAKAQEDA